MLSKASAFHNIFLRPFSATSREACSPQIIVHGLQSLHVPTGGFHSRTGALIVRFLVQCFLRFTLTCSVVNEVLNHGERCRHAITLSRSVGSASIGPSSGHFPRHFQPLLHDKQPISLQGVWDDPGCSWTVPCTLKPAIRVVLPRFDLRPTGPSSAV